MCKTDAGRPADGELRLQFLQGKDGWAATTSSTLGRKYWSWLMNFGLRASMFLRLTLSAKRKER
eukprot:7439377-Prorocentrum_lima.AAC.1